MSDERVARDAAFIGILAAAKGGQQRKQQQSSGSSSSGSSLHRRHRKLAPGLTRQPPAKPTTRRELDPIQTQVVNEELEIRRQVYKLRNELRNTRSTAALMGVLARKEEAGRQVREETRVLQGAHLSGSVKHVPPADEATVAFVATTLMKQLATIQPDPSKRGWFKLFKDFDANGDGHISFSELMDMIRNIIKMPPEVISDADIQGVWHSIDLDGNGWIDAGEFGRFFRQGEKPNQERRARKAAEKERRAQAEAEKSEFREPTLAELSIAQKRESKARYKAEQIGLQQSLQRSSANLTSMSVGNLPLAASICLPLVASNKSLPPLR